MLIPLKSLNQLRDFVPSRYPDPRYMYLRLTYRDGRLTLEGGTREERLSLLHTPEDPEDTAFDVGAPRVLLELAETLPQDPEITLRDNALHLKAGGFRAQIEVFDYTAAGFPQLETLFPNPQHETTVDAAALRKALEVYRFAKPGQTPPPMNTVWFTEEGLAASDGYTMAFRPLRTGFTGFTMNRQYAANLHKLLRDTEGPVTVRWGGEITAETPNWRYTAALTKSAIPDWKSLIPPEEPTTPLPRRELLQALRGFTALEAEILHLHLTPEGFNLAVSGQHGSAQTTVPAALPQEGHHMVNLEAFVRDLDFLQDPARFGVYANLRVAFLVLKDDTTLIAQSLYRV